MTAKLLTFEFSAPPRGDVPKWMWKARLAAQISDENLISIFGYEKPDDVEWLLLRNRAALVEAARRRAANLTAPPIKPILLNLEDFACSSYATTTVDPFSDGP